MTPRQNGNRPLSRPSSLTDEVVDAVREGVRTGIYLPGELYSVYRLAEQLGVSRSPVREALLRLAEAGLVSFERNRGFRIVLPDPRDIAEIFGVRIALEVPAARRLATTRAPKALAGVERSAAAMRAALQEGARDAFSRNDQAFHDAVLRGGGNNRAAVIVGELRQTVRLLGTSTAGHSRTLAEIDSEHLPILQALRAGDPDAAAAAMHHHLTHTGKLLVSQLLEGREESGTVDDLWNEAVQGVR